MFSLTYRLQFYDKEETDICSTKFLKAITDLMMTYYSCVILLCLKAKWNVMNYILKGRLDHPVIRLHFEPDFRVIDFTGWNAFKYLSVYVFTP